jgi:pyruvate/2-oxoglutarate dehydrogenase complex dihydrolipoamide acyltransferase (E2) component
MGTSLLQGRALRTAIAASLAFHVLVALLIPRFSTFPGNTPSLEILAVNIVPHVVIVQVHHAAAAIAAAPSTAPAIRIVANPRPVGRTLVPVTAHAELTTDRAQAPIAADLRNGASSQQRSTTAAPVASAPPQPQESDHPQRDTVGYMPLGAEQPDPVLEPAVRQSLAALGVHVTLIVTVDESGHTKSVEFQPPLGQSVEAQIRSMLASAHWDAAICGAGVACEGTATIKL